MFLYDWHCHVTTDEPAPDAANLSGEAPAVAGRLLCGVRPRDWDAVRDASASWPGTVAAYGLHPWYAADSADGHWLDALEEKLAGDADAWLGEAGLDAMKSVDPVMQRQALAVQFRLAKRLGRRVNLHCYKAWEELLALLDSEYLSEGYSPGFIVHSFAGPHQFIEPLRDRGAFFSIGPLFSRRESPRHRRRCALLPEDRLLLESDDFLRIGQDAGEDLAHTVTWLAEVRDMDVDILGRRIADNCRMLLGTPSPRPGSDNHAG